MTTPRATEADVVRVEVFMERFVSAESDDPNAELRHILTMVRAEGYAAGLAAAAAECRNVAKNWCRPGTFAQGAEECDWRIRALIEKQP